MCTDKRVRVLQAYIDEAPPDTGPNLNPKIHVVHRLVKGMDMVVGTTPEVYKHWMEVVCWTKFKYATQP